MPARKNVGKDEYVAVELNAPVMVRERKRNEHARSRFYERGVI
jgi:hypothetical protein